MMAPASPFPQPGNEALASYPPSFYAASCDTALNLPPLPAGASTDYAIIGGGFAGLGAALRLARLGAGVVLLEAGRIGWGASGRNGGQIHPGWNHDQAWFEQHLGDSLARALWQVAMEARAHLGDLAALDPDRADLRPGLLHANHRRRFDTHSMAHVRHMQDRYGHMLRYVAPEEMRELLAARGYSGGHIDPLGGHLHPLKLVMGMARAALRAGGRLHDDTPVLGLHPQGDGWRIETARGPLRAGRVLAATGGYGARLVPAVDAHVLPMQNYVAATNPLPPDLARSLIADNMAVSDSRFVVYYYRMSADHRLIFGGGESYSQRFPRDIAGFVRRHLARVFPQLADVPLEFAWGGTLSITPNRMPYAREVAPGLFSLSGFSGLGVALGPWLGAGVADAIRGAPGMVWDCLQRLPAPRFPGGVWLRRPTLAAAMTYYALRDRI